VKKKSISRLDWQQIGGKAGNAEQDSLAVTFAEADPFPATINSPLGTECVRRAAHSLGLELAEE